MLYCAPKQLPAQDSKKEWLPFDKAVAKAADTQSWLVVDVWAPWCGWCLKMQKETYPALPDELVDKFVLTKLNYDKTDKGFTFRGVRVSALELIRKFNVESVPAVIFLSKDAEYQFHISGFIDSDSLENILNEVSIKTDRTGQALTEERLPDHQPK